jgi:putative transposase
MPWRPVAAIRAELQAEVLALRRQVQVLERQIKRVHWNPGDRMVLTALRERIPRSGWAGLLVKPETVLGWHRALVRRKWAPTEADSAAAAHRSQQSVGS